jgi:hypothetical protein
MLQNKNGIKSGVANKASSTHSRVSEGSVSALKKVSQRKCNSVSQAPPSQKRSPTTPYGKKQRAAPVQSIRWLEVENRLKSEEADAELRRWKDKAMTIAFLTIAFGLCTVWGIVFLTGRFPPEDKRWVTDVFGNLVYGLICFMAGKRINRPT